MPICVGRFDNIHVWQKEQGDWKVLASMSRLDGLVDLMRSEGRS